MGEFKSWINSCKVTQLNKLHRSIIQNHQNNKIGINILYFNNYDKKRNKSTLKKINKYNKYIKFK